MKLHILILSHNRLEQFPRLLESLVNLRKTTNNELEHLREPIELHVAIGTNNEPAEVTDTKKSIVGDLALPEGMGIEIIKLGNYTTMDNLRMDLWNKCQSIMESKDYYLWLDDDDLIHPEFLLYFSLIFDKRIPYYQFNYATLEDNQIYPSYFSGKNQKIQIVHKLIRELTIADFENHRNSGLEYYRPNLALGAVYKAGYSYGMYNYELGIDINEDTVPPLHYLSRLIDCSKPEDSVCLSSACMIYAAPSTTRYDLTQEIGALISFLGDISSRFESKKMSDIMKIQISNLLKYMAYNCYHHRRYNFNAPFLGN